MAEHPGRLTRGRATNLTQGGQGAGTQGQGHESLMATGDVSGTGQPSMVMDILNSHGADSGSQLLVLPETEEEVNLYTWCEECGMNTIGDCFIHGKVITVSDNKLPSRARLSLPSILTLKKVKDSDAENETEGVFAKRLIKPRTQFGPMEAPVLPEGKILPPHVFDARVLKPGHQEQLDISQEEACNWMMFVRPARCAQECNLVAYQVQEHVYYISTRTIHQMTELRVWYLQSYGQQFGKQPLPPTLPQIQVFPESSDDTGQLNSCEDHDDSMMAVVGTRTSAALSPSKLTCGMCSAPFRSLSQLVAHNCRGIDEMPTSDGSPRSARRKSRPRKVPDSGKKGRPATRLSASQATSAAVVVEPVNTTPLPSVNTLIKTELETEVAVPDSTVSDLQNHGKKRGRPKGSKNKSPPEGAVVVEGAEEAPPKPPPAVKRKRPRLDCSHCEKSFYSEEQHKVHEAEHTGTKPYVCEQPGCGKGFGSKFKYWRHSLVHNQPQDRKCLYCDRKFNRVDHLKNHMATHSSNRTYWPCEKCGKQYLYRCTYVYHMAVHQAEEGADLMCSICGLNFTTRELLIEHVHTHNRYKPDTSRTKVFECHTPACNKKFTTAKDLRRHMVTHTKDRSFLCEFCPQTFARKDHLRRHYKSNHKQEVLEQAAAANEPTSFCGICLKAFKSEKHLKYHMSSAHKKEALEQAAAANEPASCLKVFESEKHLKYHMSSAHKEVGEAEKGGKRQAIVQVLTPQNALQDTKVILPDSVQVSAQQLQQIQSLLPQSVAQPTATPHPVQIFTNQHQFQQQVERTQQEQSLLYASSFISNHAVTGSGGQAIEIIADGNEQLNQQMLTLKTIPYRFSSSGQVLAPVQSSQPTPHPPIPAPTSLRQILSYSQPHQQHQQQQQQQQQVQQQVTQQQTLTTSDLQSTSAIVSMLSGRTDGFLDLGGKGHTLYPQDATGQLKALPAGWVIAGSNHTLSGVSTSETSDHCYATGVTTSAGDVDRKLSPLPSIGGKVMNSITSIPDIDTFRLLQNCQVGGLGLGAGMGVGGQSVSGQSTNSAGSTGLQASWDTLSDLVTIPLSDIMTPLSVSQASVINLPVTVNMPTTDGPVSVTASVTLSHAPGHVS